MIRVRDLSIRTTLYVVLVAMGLILLGFATSAVRDGHGQAVQAERVIALVRASRALLQTLNVTRFERGATLQFLAAAEPVEPETLASLYADRQRAIAGFAEGRSLLNALDLPAVTATLGRLHAARDRVDRLRPRVDTALRVSRTQREAGVAAEAQAAFQEMLEALIATSDAVDASIPLSDAILRQDLALKREAWSARMANGAVALRVQTSLAAGTSWSLDDAMAASRGARTSRRRLEVGRRVRCRSLGGGSGGVPPGRDQQLRGRPPGPAARGGERPEPRRAAGIDTRAGPQARHARADHPCRPRLRLPRRDDRTLRVPLRRGERILLRDGAALVATLLLVVLGVFVLFRGVLRPLRAMTATMEALAAGDVGVAVHGRGRHNEIGAMARAVQVFKDTLIRTRALEAEAEEARLAAERGAGPACARWPSVLSRL